MIFLLFFLLIALLILSYPVAFAIGIAAIITMLLMDIPLNSIATMALSGINSFSLMAIPFFILAGEIMGKGKIVEQIVSFANSLVGQFRGGLAHVAVVSSMIFAGVSGSGVADASAVGSMIIPSMNKQGYGKDFCVAVTASAATIGPIIPPSIPFVMYGIIAGVSIGEMFMGGIIPGILIGCGLMLTNYIICTKRGYFFEKGNSFSLKKVCISFFKSFGALLMPLIILGGIVFGIFTATEAGVAAVIYGLFYCLFINKALKISHLPKIFINAAKTSAMVMFIISMSSIFSNMLTRLGFQTWIINSILSVTSSPVLIVLMVVAFLLFLGLFIDPTVIVVMFSGTLAALGNKLGFNPIHFGVSMVIVALIGAVTPPVGSMLFVSCGIAKISIEESFKVLVPYILVLVIVALLIFFVPQIVTFIPNLISSK